MLRVHSVLPRHDDDYDRRQLYDLENEIRLRKRAIPWQEVVATAQDPTRRPRLVICYFRRGRLKLTDYY